MGCCCCLVLAVSLVVDMLREVVVVVADDDTTPKELKRLMEEVNATGGLGARFIESEEEEAVATRMGVIVLELVLGEFILGGDTNAAF